MIIDHDKDWFTRLLTFKWPLVDLFAPGQGAVSHWSTVTHLTSNDSYLMTSYDLFNQSVYPFRAFIFGFKIALILKLSVVAPFPSREHTSACPHGPWSKIGTFFESILYNATREGSILDSSLRIFWSCDIFRPIEGRYLSRDFRTRKTLYWNLIFTGFKFSLNSNRMMTHFDDSLWLSLTAVKSG